MNSKQKKPVISTTVTHTEASAGSETGLEALIRRCIENDRLAQQELYKTYYGKMMGMCRRYFSNRDDAMEALNHGFLKVFQSLEQYRHDGAFEGWMYRIIYRTVIDYLRSRVKRNNREQSLEVMDEPEVHVSPDALHRLQANDLMKLLDELPETTRAVFNMFAIEGYKHSEIAEQLNMSEGTSKWHVNRARELLKVLIEKTMKS